MSRESQALAAMLFGRCVDRFRWYRDGGEMASADAERLRAREHWRRMSQRQREQHADEARELRGD